jgi:hypothetical protein
MVTEEKLISTVVMRYRWGTTLIWLEVFTWIPFAFLKAIGENPSFFLFLPFHLFGVIGGARLRSIARKELGLLPTKKDSLGMAGRLMIFLGILVWVPYLYLKLVMGQSVEVMNYLPYHLTGVLGGVSLHILNYFIQRRRKWNKTRNW